MKSSKEIQKEKIDKVRIENYIKMRLGIKKANEDFYLVKERVSILLFTKKWDNISVYKLKENFNLIDESIDVMLESRAMKQINRF